MRKLLLITFVLFIFAFATTVTHHKMEVYWNIDQWDINTPDIDGGTVDNTTIGGTTPGAITGTTVTGTSVTDGTATLTGGDLSGIDDLTIAEAICTDNLGSAASGVTAVEYGNGHWHKTVLTVSVTVDTIAGGANLAVGNLLYTLPSGAVAVKSSYINMALDESDGNITADTPDIGLGTTVGSGANATLDAVGAATENIMTGQTADDCDGTAEVTAVGTYLYIATGGDHEVYFNIADNWAASGEDECSLAGTVILEWIFLE